MKLLYILLMVICSTSAYSQRAFKAITYNIKWNDLLTDVDTWEDRRDAMLVFFQDEDADFIGLQEVMEDQLYYIKDGLENYESIGVGRDDGKMKGEFCPIIYNNKKWKLVEFKTIWLSETPEVASRGWDAACNRIVTYGLFANVAFGDTVAVFNTHFDHKGEKARRNSVELLMDFVEEQDHVSSCLVLGDFNLEPNHRLYYTLADDFNDAKKNAYSVHEEYKGTFNGFKLRGNYQRRIDYVFYKGNLDVISYECPDLRINGRHVSDHFPVITVMKILEDE